MSAAKKVYALRDLEYGGVSFSRGQVFELRNLRNDDKMLSFGYMTPLPRNTELYICPQCGGEFIGLGERAGHVQFVHPDRALTPDEEDRAIDARESMLMQVAPLNLPGPQNTNV